MNKQLLKTSGADVFSFSKKTLGGGIPPFYVRGLRLKDTTHCLNDLLIKSNSTALKTYEVQEQTFETPHIDNFMFPPRLQNIGRNTSLRSLLRNDDGDGNENKKKLFVHFSAVVARLQCETA